MKFEAKQYLVALCVYVVCYSLGVRLFASHWLAALVFGPIGFIVGFIAYDPAEFFNKAATLFQKKLHQVNRDIIPPTWRWQKSFKKIWSYLTSKDGAYISGIFTSWMVTGSVSILGLTAQPSYAHLAGAFLVSSLSLSALSLASNFKRTRSSSEPDQECYWNWQHLDQLWQKIDCSIGSWFKIYRCAMAEHVFISAALIGLFMASITGLFIAGLLTIAALTVYFAECDKRVTTALGAATGTVSGLLFHSFLLGAGVVIAMVAARQIIAYLTAGTSAEEQKANLAGLRGEIIHWAKVWCRPLP